MPSMPKDSSATFWALDEEAFVATPSYGHSVKTYKAPSATYPTPQSLSLIYISDGENDEFIVRHMFMPNFTNLAQAEVELLEIARDGQTHEYWVGKDFINLKWREPCFVTFVLDMSNYEFYWGSQPNHDPIKFVRVRDIDNGLPPPPAGYAPNYSFYNAQPVLVDGRSAVRCTNFLKGDQAGTNLPTAADRRYYCIYLYTLVTYTSGPKHGHIIDPDGQNQGPD